MLLEGHLCRFLPSIISALETKMLVLPFPQWNVTELWRFLEVQRKSIYRDHNLLHQAWDPTVSWHWRIIQMYNFLGESGNLSVGYHLCFTYRDLVCVVLAWNFVTSFSIIPFLSLSPAESWVNQPWSRYYREANDLQFFLAAEGRMGVFIVWERVVCKPL